MPLAALALALSAAVLHASWNALAKRAGDHTIFMWLVFVVAGTLQIVPLWIWLQRREFPDAALPYVAASIAVHLLYIYLLGKAYEHGDYSMAYPILRGLGVALVPVAAIAAYGEVLNLPGYFGIAVIIVGIALIGLTAGINSSGTTFKRRSVTWPVLTGISIAAYSVIDRGGVQLLHPLPYIASFMVGSALLLIPWLITRRQRVIAEWFLNWKLLLSCGVLSIASYLLVLYAFRLAPTGYVVATRETSVIFSVLIGGLLLHEHGMKLRLIGAGTILAGVIAIALWG